MKRRLLFISMVCIMAAGLLPGRSAAVTWSQGKGDEQIFSIEDDGDPFHKKLTAAGSGKIK